jgi:hypothetical protein
MWVARGELRKTKLKGIGWGKRGELNKFLLLIDTTFIMILSYPSR